MASLTKTGISDGNTLTAVMITDLYDAFVHGKADAVLAASIFHFGIFSIREAKEFLADKGLPIRL